MKNLFVPFETAKMLKELLYLEECILYYDEHGNLLNNDPLPTFKVKDAWWYFNKMNRNLAPTYDQAEEWLWEKKIVIQVQPNAVLKENGSLKFNGVVFKYDGSEKEDFMEGKVSWTAPEINPITAKRKAIEIAVKHLHEQSKAGEK